MKDTALEQQIQKRVEYDAENRDWALQILVGVCNNSGLEIPVTLNVGGAYVSGFITKPEIYFDGMSLDFQSGKYGGAGGPEAKDLLVTVSNQLKEFSKLVPKTEQEREEFEALKYRPRYIHLRSARFYVADKLFRSFPALPKGAWWRGRIDAVDGFFIGMPFES